jgi:soluble lytic murein transglycosylase
MSNLSTACTAILLLVLLAQTQAALPAGVTNADLERQRSDYVAALAALGDEDLERFESLYAGLEGYVLRPYLRYAYLKERLHEASVNDIRAFLSQADYAPIGARLRAQWLTQLAKSDDWDTFMHEYRANSDPSLHCLRLHHLVNVGNDPQAFAPEVERLWLSDDRLPPECNPLFNKWHKAGYLSDKLVWKRIELLMARSRVSLAGELANHYLEGKDRAWVRHWQDMHRHPTRELRQLRYSVDDARARAIIKHGIVRIGYRNPEAAMEQWQRLQERYPALADDDGEVRAKLAALATQRHMPSAAAWFAAIPEGALDSESRLWALRAALRNGDWALGRRIVASLGKDEQTDRFWWYWTARIMEESGQNAKARYLYLLVAAERNYYSFLAADRLEAGYIMQHQPVRIGAAEREAVMALPGIQAAYELYLLGDRPAARRQWDWTTAQMNKRDLYAAALVAGDWDWPDRAIVTLSKSGHLNDLDLRFPIVYREIVEDYASANGLDASWVYGVMRQESAFVVDARSSAGALGLMQLMPRVGRTTAKRLKLKVRSEHAILNVENNLRLGTAFLKKLLNRHSGHQLLATAAYNAGPSRVKSWRPRESVVAADIWVETIPYEETRDYVKNVMAYTTVYDHRLQREPVRLCTRMPPVGPAGGDTVVALDCPASEPPARAAEPVRAPSS